MTDGLLALGWLAVFAGGLGTCVALRRVGVPSTYVRDLLHVGAGVWVLGWPLWQGVAAPLAIVSCAVVGVLAVPALAPRVRLAARVRDSVAGGDERWTGVVAYTLAYAAGTAAASWDHAWPAGAALLALSLGDGLGGLVGRRFGRRRFRVPGGKAKSLEGSVTVALAASVGVAVAALVLGVPPRPGLILGAGVVAAVAEALAPRATDNLLLPAAVWLVLRAASSPGSPSAILGP